MYLQMKLMDIFFVSLVLLGVEELNITSSY